MIKFILGSIFVVSMLIWWVLRKREIDLFTYILGIVVMGIGAVLFIGQAYNLSVK